MRNAQLFPAWPLVLLVFISLNCPAQVGQWTWVTGDSLQLKENGEYGPESHRPGARNGANLLVDNTGKPWVFGGFGYNFITPGLQNELWSFDPSNNLWTWEGGSKDYPVGDYGTIGVSANSNVPPPRYASAQWTDSTGNFWIFGGKSIGNLNNWQFNDLWKYDPGSNQWTWIKGDSSVSQYGVYGTLGQPAASNRPGSREYAATWVDPNGDFWLFGGWGYSSSSIGALNDLWKYDPSTNQWTWVKGSNSTFQTASYGTQGVASNSNRPGARDGSRTWTDANGDLWLYGGKKYGDFYNDLWKFDVSTGNWTWMQGSNSANAGAVLGTQGSGASGNTPGGRSLGCTWTDANGDLWMFGGTGSTTVHRTTWKYSISSNQWTWMTGDTTATVPVYGKKGQVSSTNHPGIRFDASFQADGNGGVWVFGGWGDDAPGSSDRLNDLWHFNGASQEWTWMGGDTVAALYGVHGSLGTSAGVPKPGARELISYCSDPQGNLWMFGGIGMGANDNNHGYLNDLWKYNPYTNEWTWVSGTPYHRNFDGMYHVLYDTDLPEPSYMGALEYLPGGKLALFGGYGWNRDLESLWVFDIATGEWELETGDLSQNSPPPNYGTQGVPASTNTPGGRGRNPQTWVDSQGDFWLYGGMTYITFGDLWKYDFSIGQWTWMSGDSLVNQDGVYVTPGVPNPLAKPGSRQGAAHWIDDQDNLWLFGGESMNSLGSYSLNNLWKFNPNTNLWSWEGGGGLGSTYPIQPAHYGQQGVGSTNNLPGQTYHNACWKDPSGDFWIGIGELLWKFNPGNGEWTWVTGDTLSQLMVNYPPQGQSTPNANPGWRGFNAGWAATLDAWIIGGTAAPVSFSSNSQWTNDIWKYSLDNCNLSPSPTNTTNNPVVCTGDSATFSASGSGTILWYNQLSGGSLLGTGSSYTLPPLTQSTTLYAEDFTCGFGGPRTPITITVENPGVLTLTSTPASGNLCPGDSVTLSASGANTYSWSGGVINGVPFVPNTGGYFSVTGTTMAGCITSDSILVQLVNAPSVAVSSLDPACFGDSSGMALALGSGLAGPFSYSWSNNQTGPSASNLTAGTYSVVITDTNGCMDSATTVLTQPAALSASPSSQNTLCANDSTGSATVAVSGGLMPYAFLWSSGSTSGQASNLVAGTYTVTITDNNGCTQTASTNVSAPTGLSSNTSATDVLCAGDNTGSGSISVAGGTPGYSYAWSNGSTTSAIAQVGSGFYLVTVTDNNGCQLLDSVFVDEPTALLAPAQTDLDVSCFGLSDGSVSVSPSGGTQPYSFLWTTGDQVAQVTGLPAGVYGVAVVDGNGCATADSVTITEPAMLLALAQNDNDVSCYGQADGMASSLPTGGTAPYAYAWSNGSTTSSANGLGANTYTLIVTDANGCTAADQVTIVEPDSLDFAVQTTPDSGSCSGTASAPVVGGTGPYVYQWDDPSSQSTASASSLCAGTYCVTVTDAQGCTKVECGAIIGTGLDDLSLNDAFSVYPNPNQGTFTLELGESLANQPVALTVRDVSGRIIYTSTVNTSYAQVQLPAVSAGLYLLEVHAEGRMGMKRLVVQ